MKHILQRNWSPTQNKNYENKNYENKKQSYLSSYFGCILEGTFSLPVPRKRETFVNITPSPLPSQVFFKSLVH